MLVNQFNDVIVIYFNKIRLNIYSLIYLLIFKENVLKKRKIVLLIVSCRMLNARLKSSQTTAEFSMFLREMPDKILHYDNKVKIRTNLRQKFSFPCEPGSCSIYDVNFLRIYRFLFFTEFRDLFIFSGMRKK